MEIAVQALDQAFLDLQAMLPAQWEHTGDSDVPCQPNWELYRQMEARGAAFLVMARDDAGEPMGYMTAFIYPHPNAMSVRIAEIRTYYIDKRHPMLLRSLATFTMAELARRGIYKVRAWTSAVASASAIWQRLGFEVSEVGLTLRMKPGEAKHA